MSAGDPGWFGDEARRAIYDVIGRRRDIRHFRAGAPLPDETLARILGAAHQAPSVGYSQPWDFIVVRDHQRRLRIKESFLRVRAAEAARFPVGERRDKYLAYRLEGILESAVNVCVTADLRPADEAVLGTTAQPEALRASALCAVQNLWLAARAENVGVGWVSIVEPAVLRQELSLPAGVEPVAYLCLGEPLEFRDRPLLEETGWRARRPLAEATHAERYRPQQRMTPATEDPLEQMADPSKRTPAIPPFSQPAADASRRHQATLCKPQGSLGRLEELAAWWAGARGRFPSPPPARVALYVFVADHGVVEEGVSAWPSSVTAAMVANFLAGGAAVNQLARALDVRLTVVDVGVAGDLSSLPLGPLAQGAAASGGVDEREAAFVAAKVRAGTANLRREAAMTRAEAEAAIAVGQRLAAAAAGDGVELLLAGEMGIGNSTAAAALLCALADVAPAVAVGRGAGLDDAGVARKAAVVADALARHRPSAADPLATLAAVGGLEIAALAGFMLGGAAARVPVVVDGFISGAAALVACALAPPVKDYLLLSHRSAESGAGALCRALGKEPLYDLGLRLGEGTGALLAVELVRHAVRLQLGMATFSQAGVPGRAGLKLDGE